MIVEQDVIATIINTRLSCAYAHGPGNRYVVTLYNIAMFRRRTHKILFSRAEIIFYTENGIADKRQYTMFNFFFNLSCLVLSIITQCVTSMLPIGWAA